MFHFPKQSHLAKILSRSQSCYWRLRAILLTEDLDFAIENNVEVPRQLSLLKYNLSGLIVGPGNPFGPDNIHLDNITTKEQLQGPVEDYPQLALNPGNLKEVVSAVQPPGREPRQLEL